MSAKQTISPRGRYVIRAAVAAAIREAVRGGASVESLAARLGVTSKSVGNWASGGYHPSFVQAVRIAPLVGVDPETGKRESAA